MNFDFDADAAFANDHAAARAFSAELQSLHLALAAAANGKSLQQVAAGMRAVVRRALDVAPAEALTRLISALSDALAQRVIEVACAEMPQDQRDDLPDWCWVALGSEGRQEQTFASDQDNAIIFADSDNAEARRERLLPLALRVNLMLADCGFPLCRGQIMASNPQCCLSLREWQARFLEWMIEGDAEALLNASIFFDFRALYGNASMALALGDWLSKNAADNPRFLLQMTENTLQRQAPLGLLRDFVVARQGDFAGTIDLKLQAATLFVDAARVYGLACGSHASNTADRLRQAVQSGMLEREEVEASIRAFYFIALLRLKCQHASAMRGEAMHNHVAPAQLANAERRALLHALRQARTLQQHLAHARLG